MFSKIKSAQQVLSVEFHPGVAYHEAIMQASSDPK